MPVLLTALESGRGTELNLYGSLPLRWVHKPITQASDPVKFFGSRARTQKPLSSSAPCLTGARYPPSVTVGAQLDKSHH